MVSLTTPPLVERYWSSHSRYQRKAGRANQIVHFSCQSQINRSVTKHAHFDLKRDNTITDYSSIVHASAPVTLHTIVYIRYFLTADHIAHAHFLNLCSKRL